MISLVRTLPSAHLCLGLRSISTSLSSVNLSVKARDNQLQGKWSKRKKMILPSFVDLSLPTVEEAVDNILYNNPIVAPTIVKKHTVRNYISKITVELFGV